MNKRRIFYYDALRAIAIIGIVACHMSGVFLVKTDIASFNWYCLLSLNTLRQFSIPIFVMLSGALLINKDYSLSNFIKKKFNRILVPYIFWVIIFLLASFLLVKFGIESNLITTYSLDYLINCSLGLTKGITKGRYLWFIWMILVVYLVLILLNKILIKVDEDKNKLIINGLVLFFLAYCLIIVPSGIVKIGAYNNTILYYISFSGYGILGYYLANGDFSFSNRFNKKIMSIGFFTLFLILFVYTLIEITNLSLIANKLASISYFKILTLLLASSIFLSFRYFEEANEEDESIYSKIRNGIVGTIINSLSRCSFGIYVIHTLVYIFYKDIIFRSMHIFSRNPIKWSLLLIVLVLFTSWAIILIMSRIPYLEKVSGA